MTHENYAQLFLVLILRINIIFKKEWNRGQMIAYLLWIEIHCMNIGPFTSAVSCEIKHAYSYDGCKSRKGFYGQTI